MTQHYSDVAVEVAKSTPAVTVVGLTLFGVALQDWVFIATLILIAMQAGFLLRDKWWRQRKGKHGRK